MKLINRWSMLGFNIFMLFLLTSSVALAQNAVRLPQQSLPSFLGYVEDEFIVVFSPESRRKVTVTRGQGGKPQVNLPSINALTNQYGIQRFQRQFPNAKAQTATSQFVDLTGHYKVLLKPGRDLTQALHAFEASYT